MGALTQPALDFLRDLSNNNNKDWFTSHKSRFEKDLKKPFEQWIGELIQAFHAIAPAIMIKPQVSGCQAVQRLFGRSAHLNLCISILCVQNATSSSTLEAITTTLSA